MTSTASKTPTNNDKRQRHQLDEREGYNSGGGKPASGPGAGGSGGAAAVMNDSQPKSGPGGGEDPADAGPGSLPRASLAGDANTAGDNGGAEGREEQAEGGGGGGGEEAAGVGGADGGDDGVGSGDGEGDGGAEEMRHEGKAEQVRLNLSLGEVED